MRLSTSTNLVDPVCGKYGKIPAEECLRGCRQSGFRVMDFSFFDQERPGMPMNEDNWETWLHDIRKYSDRLGLEFPQTHPNFFEMFSPDTSGYEWNQEKVRRGVIGSGILGAKRAVFHIGTACRADGSIDDEESLKTNVEYLRPLLKLAHEHGVGLTSENLGANLFARIPENLIRLVDELDNDVAGICWDFGHANIMKLSQTESLRKIGRRLKATHIADDHGEMDEHLSPFFGNINWREMVHCLREIKHEGDLTYEIQNIIRNLPDEYRDTLIRHFVELGEYTLSLWHGGRRH